MTKEQAMRDFVLSKVGCGYIYGATGWVCTEARRKQQAKQYPDFADVILGTGAKWDGRECYDCAQLTRRAMELIGLKPPSGATSQYKRQNLYGEGGPIGELPAGRLAQLFRVGADGTAAHTGWAIGDGTAVDARGHKEGVVQMALNKYPWTHYKLIAGAEGEYEGEAPEAPEGAKEPEKQGPEPAPADDTAVVLAPVRLRKSTDTSSSANVIRLLGAGDVLQVLAVAQQGIEVWVHVRQDVGAITHRGWALAQDAQRKFIQLPESAVIQAPEMPEKLYTATIAGLSAAQVDQLVRAWPQALFREVS